MAQAGKKPLGRPHAAAALPAGRGWWLAFVLLVLAVTVAATAVVYSTHRSRHLLNELQALERERNAMRVEWGRLLLEQSSMASQGRVEEIAISELGMQVPAMNEVVIVNGD